MNLRKKTAMLKRWINIVTGKSATAVKQGVGKYYSTTEIKGYYNDFSLKVGSGTLLSEEGIPLTEITGGERVHFPIVVFQYALALYDLFLGTGERGYADGFLKIADWALGMQREDGSWDAFGPVKSKKYTVSSMCQGEGASVLFRAGKLSGRAEYTEAGFNAIDFMLCPMENGGTAVYGDDELYLEEYPQVPRRSVLNGWIFSAFGLYDAMLLDEKKYAGPFRKTAKTICSKLRVYDKGYWSLYDMRGKLASPAYHELHIALLTVLMELYPDDALRDMCEKFTKYGRSGFNRILAVAVKAAQKLGEDSDVITVK